MKDLSDLIDRLSHQVRDRARKFWMWSVTSTTRLPEFATVAFIGIVIFYVTRNSWFFGDDWKFLVFRRDLWNSGHRFEAIFTPHNEHLSAVPSALYLILENIVGIGTTVPYFTLLIAGHIAVLWGLRTVLVRLDVPLVARLVALIWFGAFGAGAENLVWPFQVSFIWSFAFALWGLLLLTDKKTASIARDISASVFFLLAILTASTGMSVVAVAFASVALASRSIIRLARIFLLPLGVYALWYFTYAKSRIASHPSSMSQLVPFFTKGISFGFDQTLQFAVVGLLVGLGSLVLISTTTWFESSQRKIVAMLGSILVVFYLVGAVGRGYLGPDQATASRYVYFCGALAIPIVVVAGVILVRKFHRFWPLFCLLLAIGTIGNFGALLAFRNSRLATTNELKWRFAMAAAHAENPLADLAMLPDPQFNPDLTLAGIAGLRSAGIWSYEVPLSSQQQLEGSLQFGTRIFPAAPDMTLQAYKASIAGLNGVSLVPTASGCLIAHPISADPSVVLEPREVGTFSIDTRGLASALRLQDESNPAVRTDSKDLLTEGSLNPVWVGVYPVFGQPVIELPAGVDTTLCGLRQ